MASKNGDAMKKPIMVILLALICTGAQAGQTGILTLACAGMISKSAAVPSDDDSKAISMSVVVNFADKTVSGFSGTYLVKIKDSSEAMVTFDGSVSLGGDSYREFTSGTIDRFGNLDVLTRLEYTDPYKLVSMWDYKLQCRPAERLW
jgi:hypothetical protein